MKHKKKLKLMKQLGLMLAGGVIATVILKSVMAPKEPVIPVPMVVVKKPALVEITDYVTQTGNTVAINSVNLVARVEGYLNAVEFVDGTFVKKGKELFIIQPEPYMEKLKEAKASVAAQKASSAYSKAEHARQERMYKENATSLNNVEKWLAKTQENEADLDKAIANEAIAAINYGYTHISAPFDGRIGRHLVDPGNLVGNGVATNLATIEQIDPIYIYFNLNELDLLKLRHADQGRGYKGEDIHKVPVYVNLQSETGFNHVAKLDFVNTGLNAATGTMELRAILENKDLRFVPGLFVTVRLPISKPVKRLTVPVTAVLSDQIGAYLLVVDEKNIVQLKRVELGGAEQGMRAIVKGLNATDRVIVDGLQNATPGNQVDVREQAEKAAK